MMNCFGDKDTEILILQRSEKTLFERTKTLEKTVSVLREELATSRTNEYNAQVRMSEQHDRLTAAEQRNVELLVMLRQAWVDERVSAEDCRKIDAALKPIESGASE